MQTKKLKGIAHRKVEINIDMTIRTPPMVGVPAFLPWRRYRGDFGLQRCLQQKYRTHHRKWPRRHSTCPPTHHGGQWSVVRGRLNSLQPRYLLLKSLLHNLTHSSSFTCWRHLHTPSAAHLSCVYFVSPVLYTVLLRLSPYQLAPCELGPLYRSEYVYIFITIHCCACFERSTTCCKLSRKLWTWF